MDDIEIYTTPWCPYCIMAKRLLISKGLNFREIDVASDPERRREMMERSRRRTVPQIFINSESIGGYDDLNRINASGDLDRMLGNE